METHDLNILAIDDNRDNLTILKAVVMDRLPEARVLVALDGAQGLDLAFAYDPDVILLDIVMPAMDGYAVCRKLKSDLRLRVIPVVFLTALRTDRESRIKALEAGADGFLSKPFDEVELIAQIMAMVKIKAANRSRALEKQRLAALVGERTRELERELAERRRAEEALRENNSKFLSLADNLPGYMAYINADTLCYEFVNAAVVRAFGIPRERIVGRPVREIIGEDNFRFASRYIDKALSGESTSYENTFDLVAGRRWVQVNHTPVFGEEGRVVSLVMLGYDITERKLTEDIRKTHISFLENLERIDREIKQETDVEKMLWNVVGQVFAIFDCDRAWLFFPCDPDEAYFRIPVEVCRPEFPGAFAHDLDIPTSPDLACHLRQVLASDSPVISTARPEGCMKASLAEQFGMQSKMMIALYPKLGKPWMLGMHQCSSPRIWTEDEQKLFKEIARRVSDGLSSVLFLRELQENEQKFRSTFEQAAVGIAHVSADGRWLRVNNRLCDILGYTREEILQKKFEDITFIEDSNIDFEYMGQILRGEIPTFSIEKRYVRKDGSIVWINLTVSMVLHAAGEPAYFISVIEDISKRKGTEEERARLQSQLNQAQKMEAIGLLAGGIAHDFNNILAAIIGYADMARDEIKPDINGNLSQVLASANRAKELVRQILSFSRPSAGNWFPVKVQPLVMEALKMLRASIPSTIRIVESIHAQCGSVLADPTQISQIVMNLCSNAFQAMEQTGGILSLALNPVSITRRKSTDDGTLAPGDYVELTVSDTGAGIKSEIVDRIFDPYFTTKEVGEGTGLGLSITQGIVKSYGGAIRVESSVGRCTTFRIYLPCIRDEIKEAALSQEIPMGRGSILFVDDEEVLARMGKSMLERLGYSVTACTGSLDALEVFTNDPARYDLVITDQTMPGMTGMVLARRLLDIRPDLPIILCTGFSTQADEQSVKAVGIRAFALKPLSKTVLSQLVKKILDPDIEALSHRP